MAKFRWRVDIIESERGWGSKVDERKFFDDENTANRFVEKYNAKNTEKVVPAWYMYADSPRLVQVD